MTVATEAGQRIHVLKELRSLFDGNVHYAKLNYINSPNTVQALTDLSREIERLEKALADQGWLE